MVFQAVMAVHKGDALACCLPHIHGRADHQLIGCEKLVEIIVQAILLAAVAAGFAAHSAAPAPLQRLGKIILQHLVPGLCDGTRHCFEHLLPHTLRAGAAIGKNHFHFLIPIYFQYFQTVLPPVYC